MSIGIVIQCRTGSTRFPRKAFEPLNGRNSVQRILAGCSKTVYPHKVILAVPKEDAGEFTLKVPYYDYDQRFNLFVGPGESSNLVDRYYQTMRTHQLDVCVRLTADCPMIEGYSWGIDEILEEYLKVGTGYMCNNSLVAPSPYPMGLDVEVFTYEMLCWAKRHAQTKSELEHCCPVFYSGLSPFPTLPFNNLKPHTQVSTRIHRFDFDTTEDYQLLWKLTAAFDRTQDLNAAIEEVSKC
jgi:spore coat polysaccharide biosynthesis protein SpsF